MVGKIVPYFGIGVVQVLVILAAAALIFEVPFVGSLTLLLAVTLLFTLVSLSLGFAMWTPVSQPGPGDAGEHVLSDAINPAVGLRLPYRGMPVVIQWLAELLPPTHYIRLVRGIMLAGGVRMALPKSGVLLAMLLVLGLIAVRRSRCRGLSRGRFVHALGQHAHFHRAFRRQVAPDSACNCAGVSAAAGPCP